MNAYSPVCENRSAQHLAQSLRTWRIALAAYGGFALFAAGWLSATAVAVLFFVGFSILMILSCWLKARLARLRMDEYLDALSDLSERS